MSSFLRSLFLLFCLHVFSCMQAIAQDSILEPQSISIAGITAKEIAIDLNDPEETELALKKIHTYTLAEKIVLQGETDEMTWKKIISRLSILKNLSTLTLKDNELSAIPENITSLKTLRSLTIEGNTDLDFIDLCKKIKILPLTELNLIDNDLKKTPTTLAEIPSLRKIQLTGSDRLNYEELMEQLAKLPALTTLAIPVNYLTEVPKNISLLKSLQVLDVSNNVLTELPGEISALKAINNLSIQGNLLLNPLKELEKLKGADILFLSLDKEISGEEIAQLKKMFPRAEINFPVNEEEKSETTETAQPPVPEKITYNGELKVKKDLAILSGAYIAYPALFRNLVYNFDTLNFEERYADFRYSKALERFRNGAILTSGYYLTKVEPGKKQPGGKKKEICFQLLSPKFFPELNAFSGMYWIYSGELNRREFKKKFLARKQRRSIITIPVRWQDIRIVYDKNNSLFTLELKGENHFEKFTAYPVQPTVTFEKNQQTYNRRYLMYQKALLRRSQTFNREHLKSKRAYDINFKKLKGYAWKELQLRMSNEEKLMSETEWLEYYDNIIENEKTAIANSSLASGYLLRALSLCGYTTISALSTAAERTIAPPSNGLKNINVDFINEESLGKLPVTTVWVIDNQSKYFYSFVGSLGTAPSTISIMPHSSYSIIVQLRNGDLGTATLESSDKPFSEPGKIIPMKVKVLDKNLNTTGELLKAAGIH